MLPPVTVAFLAAAFAPAPLHDTTVLCDDEVVAGSDATLYIRVEAAHDLDRSEPLAGAEVRLRLDDAPLALAHTGADGVALVRFSAPPAGAHELVIETRSALGEDRVVRPLRSVERTLFVLRTDRTQYPPGQPIRWRTTLLNEVDGQPQRGAPLTFELEDARGTLLWRGAATSDAAGMASGEIPMSDAVRGGDFVLSARSGGRAVNERVEVKRLALPRFFVELVDLVHVDVAGPGGKTSGRVVARYPYGEPVVGTARVVCGGRRLAEGALVGGAFAFADVECAGGLKAEVRDGVGLEAARVTFAAPDTLLWVVPSRTQAEPGGTVQVTAVTSDANGHYLPASIVVSADKGRAPAVVESPGVVRFDALADDHGEVALRLTATIGGRTMNERVTVGASKGAPIIDVPALAPGGRALEVTGSWPAPRGPVVVTLLRDDAPIATALATVDGDGHLRARLMPAVGVHGLVDVRAVEIGSSQGGARSASATAFLAPEALTLDLGGEARHRPGERAELPLRVSDRRGEPVAGVGLSVSVVDERALRLSTKARADLGAEMRALGAAGEDRGKRRVFTADRAATIGSIFARLSASPSPEDQLAARAIIEDLRQRVRRVPTAFVSIDKQIRAATEERRIRELEPLWVGALDQAATPSFVKQDGAWVPRATIEALWRELGKAPAAIATPWGVPTDWAYARRFDDALDQRLADLLVSRRIGALLEALRPLRRTILAHAKAPTPAELAARLAPPLMNDPWGQPFVLSIDKVFDRPVGRWVRVVDVRSAGPDEVLGTADDPYAHDVFGALYVRVETMTSYGFGLSGDGVGSGLEVAHNYGLGVDIPDKALRRRFDETVLWATGIATGPDGGATITVPLADSITGWRVQVEAVAPDGRVGALTSRLETFLPRHLDAEAPARLVVGDRYGMRVIAASHGVDAGGALTLVASADGGLATDASPVALEVPAGEARAATIPLLAVAPGEGRVRVAWVDSAGNVVDAVERRVTIEPLGSKVELTVPGRIVDGHARFDVEVPSDIAAAASTTVRVYRGLSDVTFDALASILQEPHGCFEQTSSTTHPNLLVLELLDERSTAPEVAEARARAQELVAKGYQRLASFEVEGGGFSLFGQAPASTILTAYGLLELTDIGRVQAVDQPMLQRAAAWLAAQQKPDGTWADDRAHHGEMGRGVTTAFVAWAIAEARANGFVSRPIDKALDKALDHLARAQSNRPDAAYGLALWAGAEALAQRTPIGGPALARFAHDDGDGNGRSYPAGTSGTAMYASGDLATVQSTALAAMALARGGSIVDAGRAVDWLLAARTRGVGWGSSHGVMLALRAAVIVEGGNAKAANGAVAIEVDGRPSGALALTGVGVPTATLDALGAGAHTITLSGDVRGLRADLRLAWRSASAPTAVADGFAVHTMGSARTAVGKPMRQFVSITNTRAEATAMPTVVIPIPAGWRADDDATDDLRAVPGVAFAEDVGDALHVYFETLAAGATVDLPVTLVADVPCAVTQRPIEVFAYYDPMIRGSTPSARLVAD